MKSVIKINSLFQLYELLPEEERLIVDVLRQIIKENLPVSCKEKISYNVPFFYGKKGICIVWPSTVPRGGIKQGVFKSVIDINQKAIIKLLKEAVKLDSSW